VAVTVVSLAPCQRPGRRSPQALRLAVGRKPASVRTAFTGSAVSSNSGSFLGYRGVRFRTLRVARILMSRMRLLSSPGRRGCPRRRACALDLAHLPAPDDLAEIIWRHALTPPKAISFAWILYDSALPRLSPTAAKPTRNPVSHAMRDGLT